MTVRIETGCTPSLSSHAGYPVLHFVVLCPRDVALRCKVRVRKVARENLGAGHDVGAEHLSSTSRPTPYPFFSVMQETSEEVVVSFCGALYRNPDCVGDSEPPVS